MSVRIPLLIPPIKLAVFFALETTVLSLEHGDGVVEGRMIVRRVMARRVLGRVLLGAWLGLLCAGSVGGGEPASSAADAEFFENNIRPVLVRKCQNCHGSRKQEGELRLDSRDGVLTGGESGPAVVPGKPDESLLLEAIRYESFEMPPERALVKAEIDAFEEWIQRGAPWPKIDRVKLRSSEQPAFSEADRNYWAFQPIEATPIPETRRDEWCRTPVDAFILSRLKDQNLSPAPAADRLTLIRRVYFDTIGLPPTPEEVEAYVSDAADDDEAYARLVDRLLASPHFGERMAQHWLDLVRFAESDGYRADAFRESAWRYRDYVVRSFNSDKPYDRFVTEQLAADEVAEDDPEVRIATTFLRLGVYESNQRDARFHWTLIVDEMTDVIGETFLGLSMACARCHDHKFDPILRRDYYRLQAYFAPMIWDDSVPAVPESEADRYRNELAKWRESTAELRAQIAKIEDPIRKSLRDAQVSQFPEDVQAIYAKPASNRTWLEQQLAYLVHRQVLDRYAEVSKKLKGNKEWKTLQEQLDKEKPPAIPRMMAVRDVEGAVSPTLIPGTEEAVEPGPLSILDAAPAEVTPPDGASHSTGRRLALARWITDPNNPLPARVIVNRIWQYYFGRAIVETSSEFGRMGRPPSHPALLDYLAWQLVHGDEPWRLKKLHRVILLSATYRQSTLHPQAAQCEQVDAENRLFWRADTRRLDADQLRDAILAATGKLDRTIGGPSVTGKVARRSIYVRRMRNSPDPLLNVFDAPSGFVSTGKRDRTTTPLQTLLMWNSSETIGLARQIAERIMAEGHGTAEAQIERACRLILCRVPGGDWRRRAAEYVRRGRSVKSGKVEDGKSSGDAVKSSIEPLVDVCHVLLNANSFSYID